MSKQVDERVVSMQFDNAHFERNVNQSMSTLDKLKQSLNLTGATKGLENVNAAAKDVNMNSLGKSVDEVGVKFSAMQVIAVTALSTITSSVVNTGIQLAKSLSIDQLTAGWTKYADKTAAVQTIMSATGKSIDEVSTSLDKLNWFTDETSYNLTDMTANIGKFTAQGVDLDTAVTAMQGISTWASLSGQGVNEASRAMYNLSQSIGVGSVKLMDWRSIENANMGTKEFKEQALKAAVAAKTLTKSVDASGKTIYKTSKGTVVSVENFSTTLQEGWFTSKALLSTLKNYGSYADGLYELYNGLGEGVDKTTSEIISDLKELQGADDETILNAGYTKEQLELFKKLSKEVGGIGQRSFAAAQEAKTFAEAINATKDAVSTGWLNTFEIIFGNYEEAKVLWTDLANTMWDVFASGAEARNELLKEWKELGGRDDLIQSFWNIYDAISSIVGPIKEAFREIFPPITAKQLFNITKAIKEFTAKLTLTEAASEKLKSTFKGIFAVIDIVVTVVKEVISGVVKLAGNLVGLAKNVIGITGSFGDWLSGLRNTIKQSNILGKVVSGIVNILQNLIDKIKIVIGFIKEKIVAPGFENFLSILKGVWNVMSWIGQKIIGVARAIGGALVNAFRTGDIKAFMDAFNTGVLGGILLNIKAFFDNMSDGFGIASIIDNIKSVLGSVKDALTAYQTDLKAKTLLKIAAAIAILAAAVLVIASIDPVKLAASLGAITVLFSELMGTMAIFTKVAGKMKGAITASIMMIAMSTAVLILASALKKISNLNPEQLMTGIVGVAAMMGILIATCKLMTTDKKTVIKGAGQMLIMSVALNIMALAIKQMSAFSWKDLAKGLAGLAVTLGLLVGALAIMSKTKDAKGAGQMLVMAISLNLIGLAIKQLSSLGWEELGKGVAAMAVTLGLLVGTLAIMSAIGGASGAGQMLLMAIALNAIALALKVTGGMEWESIAKGLVALGGSLLILAAGLNLMNGTLAGSAALLIAVVAIGALVPSLLLLGAMSWESIIKGLVTLAGAFTIIGVAGLVLGPLVGVILGLSGAIALIGIGVLAAGVGLVALSVGITSLATAISASGTIIVSGITMVLVAIIGLIPSVIAAIGNGIILILQIIADSVGAICEAVAAIIVGVCEALIISIPKILETVGVLLDALLKFIVEYVPKIVVAGMQLIIGLLDGISKNIGKVVAKAIDVVNAFLRAIGKELPRVIDAGFKMIIDFVNGLAEAIEENIPDLIKAATNLGTAIIKGVIKGLASMPGIIWDAICDVGQDIIDGFCDFLGINSPAKVMIPIGQSLDEGMVVGLENYASKVVDASEEVGDEAVKSMADTISGISSILESETDAQPTIRPVLDLSDVEAGAKSIGGIFSGQPSVGVLSNVNAINSSMGKRNINEETELLISEISKLRNDLSAGDHSTYYINGITYDDGSNIAEAIKTIARAAKVERRL